MHGIGTAAFETEAGEIAGPIKIGKKFAVIKVISIKESSYKTFEEAKNYAQARARREFIRIRSKEWLAELRDEIDVTIYENRLEKTFSN